MKHCLILALLLPVTLLAQSAAPDSTNRFTGFPSASYSDEMGFGGGGILYYLHRPADMAPGQNPNTFNMLAMYTTKKQFKWSLRPDVSFDGGNWRVRAELKYLYWPSTYYGLGNDTDLDDGEDFNLETTKLEVIAQRKLNDRFSVLGLGYWRRWGLFKRELGGALLDGSVPGARSMQVAAAGLGLSYDTRDDLTFPTSGGEISARVWTFQESLGGDQSWNRLRFEITRFHALSSRYTLAFQGLGVFNDDMPPFLEMARLGEEMRGVADARFVGRHMALTRGELRAYPFAGTLLSRVGFAAFVETGRVADSFETFTLDGLKLSGGGGLRFILLPGERLALRFDYGVSADDTEIEVAASEAF